MAADGFLKNLVQLRCVILSASRSTPDPPADAKRGNNHEGQHCETDDGEPPVLLDDNPEQEDHRKRLPHPVRQYVRRGYLDLFEIYHDGRHQAPGGIGFEEMRILAQHAIENFLAEIGDGGESNVVHHVVAKIVAKPFHQKYSQNRDRDHSPHVVNGCGDEVL